MAAVPTKDIADEYAANQWEVRQTRRLIPIECTSKNIQKACFLLFRLPGVLATITPLPDSSNDTSIYSN